MYYVRHRWAYYKEAHIFVSAAVVLMSVAMPQISYFSAVKSTAYYTWGIPVMAMAILESLIGVPLYLKRPYKFKKDVKKFIKEVHKVLGFLTWFLAIVHTHFGMYSYMTDHPTLAYGKAQHTFL